MRTSGRAAHRRMVAPTSRSPPASWAECRSIFAAAFVRRGYRGVAVFKLAAWLYFLEKQLETAASAEAASPRCVREQQAEPHVAMVPRSRSLLLPPPTPPVLRRHLLGRGRAALQGARLLSTATQHKVVDIAGASDTKGMSEQGNILLVEKELQFKPLERPAGAEIIVPGGGQLFASSDDPLAHTEADVGKSVRLPLLHLPHLL